MYLCQLRVPVKWFKLISYKLSEMFRRVASLFLVFIQLL